MPKQEIRNGVAEIIIIEGYIASILISKEADLTLASDLVRRYLENLVSSEPITYDHAEHYLLLARDIPGIWLYSSFQPSATGLPGAIDLVVDITHSPVSFVSSLDNLRSEAFGEFAWVNALSINSFTPLGEQNTLLVTTDGDFDNQQLYGFSASQNLGAQGFRLYESINYSITDLKVGQFAGEADSLVWNVRGEYPILRSRKRSVWIGAGFDYADIESSLLNTQIVDDKLRTTFLYGRGFFQPFSQIMVNWRGELRKGFEFFGASRKNEPALSRVGGVSDPLVFRGSGSTRVNFTDSIGSSIYGRFQVASDPLLSYDNFDLGNLTIGRGYATGDVSGDHGFGLGLEADYTLYNRDNNIYWDSAQLFSFVEGGHVFSEQSIFKDQSIASVGVGLRLFLLGYLRGEVYYAHPLTDLNVSGVDDDGGQVFFKIGFVWQ